MIYQDEIDALRKAADELERKQREYIEKSKGYYIALDSLHLPEYRGGVRKITRVDLIGRRTPESAEALCEKNKMECMKVSPDAYKMLVQYHHIYEAKNHLLRITARGINVKGLIDHINKVLSDCYLAISDLGFEKELHISINRLS